MEKSVTGRSLRQFQTFLIHEEKSPATVQKYMRELQRQNFVTSRKGICLSEWQRKVSYCNYSLLIKKSKL